MYTFFKINRYQHKFPQYGWIYMEEKKIDWIAVAILIGGIAFIINIIFF